MGSGLPWGGSGAESGPERTWGELWNQCVSQGYCPGSVAEKCQAELRLDGALFTQHCRRQAAGNLCTGHKEG